MSMFTPDHIHPMLVNFTAALVPASVASDVVGRFTGKQTLHAAAWWMLAYATAITPLTALAGLWWKQQLGPGALPPHTIAEHMWLGIGLAVLFVVMAVWRWRIYKRDGRPGVAYFLLGLIAVAALVVQGELGGSMLFG